MGHKGSKAKRRSSDIKKAGAAPKQAPLGEWVSPISSASIVEKAVKLTGVTVRESDGALFWLEMRPTEAGRQVLVMRSPDGAIRDVTPPPAADPSASFNVRTTVHEYGGGEYFIVGDAAYFVNYRDQALYVQDLTAGAVSSEPRLVTHGSADRGERFADMGWDAARNRLVAISEVHKDMGTGAELPPDRVVSRLVAVDVSSGAVTPLASGADFYASPRVSPCGRWLAWVEWRFPNMPWDHTSLMVAPVQEDGTLGPPTRLSGAKEEKTPAAGGGGDEKKHSAVQQPVWAPDSSYLYYVDDCTGWWNLYRRRTPGTPAGAGGGAEAEQSTWDAGDGRGPEALYPMEAEWGFPFWTLDRYSYTVLADGSVLGLFTDPRVAGVSLGLLQPPPPAEGGSQWTLSRIDTGLTQYDPPRVAVRQHTAAAAAAGPSSSPSTPEQPQPQQPQPQLTVAVIGSAPQRRPAVIAVTAPSVEAVKGVQPEGWQVVKESSTAPVPEGYISSPEAIEFPTTLDGQPTTAFMLYYPPTNKDFTLPPGVLPPLLVKSHGGPTSGASAGLNLGTQYYTSRGFAVADIDYGGSTGYGTAYRNRLQGRWGLVDVQDCCAAAEWLVAAGRVDGGRLCITGGSAGGFTTLACLAFRKTFSAGASHYGVADLKLLAEHTHKFESRYLDLLLGPLPEATQVYDDRSPLKHVSGMSAPVIFFQGDQDKVVPPEQAIAMHEAVKAAGLPTALVMLAGEQHGFRQAANIRRALDGELFFFGTVLGFPAAMPEDLPGIDLDNPPHKEQGQEQEQGQQQQEGKEEGEKQSGEMEQKVEGVVEGEPAVGKEVVRAAAEAAAP